MNCPRCKKTLVPGRLHELSLATNVMTCDECKGIFLGPDVLTDVTMQERSRFFEFRRIPNAVEQQAPLVCPACTVGMDKVRSESDDKVVMDLCPKCHHTWLDRGEIDAIQTESLLSNLASLFRGATKS